MGKSVLFYRYVPRALLLVLVLVLACWVSKMLVHMGGWGAAELVVTWESRDSRPSHLGKS